MYTKTWYSQAASTIMSNHAEMDLFLLPLVHEADEIYREAMALVDSFHQARKKLEAQLDQKDRGFLSCRVQRKDLGIRITWMIQHPVAKRRRMPGGPTVLSEAINKPRSTDTYARSRVITHNSKKYEAELFEAYEPYFARIRTRSKKLGAILRACGYYRKHFSKKGLLRDERFYAE